MRSESGFTLIELIVVIVIISTGLAGLARLFGNSSIALVKGEEQQNATRYAQECAERVLKLRRDSGWASIGFGSTSNTLCSSPTGYTTTVTLSAAYSNAVATPWCPTNTTTSYIASCGDVTVKVQSNKITSASSIVVFMLVQ